LAYSARGCLGLGVATETLTSLLDSGKSGSCLASTNLVILLSTSSVGTSEVVAAFFSLGHIVVGFDDETVATWTGSGAEGRDTVRDVRHSKLWRCCHWVGETFYDRIKESVPCPVGNDGRERTG
jgi:hypothetical protein